MMALVAASRGAALVPASATHLRMDGVMLRPLRTVWRHDVQNPVPARALELLDALRPLPSTG